MAYHDNQPFNDNLLRPCPMLENPECLVDMVEQTGAHSTDMESPEDVRHLCGKCKERAEQWAPVAEAIWTDETDDRAKWRARTRECRMRIFAESNVRDGRCTGHSTKTAILQASLLASNASLTMHFGLRKCMVFGYTASLVGACHYPACYPSSSEAHVVPQWP